GLGVGEDPEGSPLPRQALARPAQEVVLHGEHPFGPDGHLGCFRQASQHPVDAPLNGVLDRNHGSMQLPSPQSQHQPVQGGLGLGPEMGPQAPQGFGRRLTVAPLGTQVPHPELTHDRRPPPRPAPSRPSSRPGWRTSPPPAAGPAEPPPRSGAPVRGATPGPGRSPPEARRPLPRRGRGGPGPPPGWWPPGARLDGSPPPGGRLGPGRSAGGGSRAGGDRQSGGAGRSPPASSLGRPAR